MGSPLTIFVPYAVELCTESLLNSHHTYDFSDIISSTNYEIFLLIISHTVPSHILILPVIFPPLRAILLLTDLTDHLLTPLNYRKLLWITITFHSLLMIFI